MSSIVSITNLSKTYRGGFQALKNVNLEIERGEIIALLGPNGAGKTTLISIICGIVNATQGSVTVDGYSIVSDYRMTRSMIGLVPQELSLGAFEKVWNTLSYSRGLFGKKPDPGYLEQVLKDLSLWDKRDNRLMTLSGGMKRRVLIAKALAHEPTVLFLDEPTAGVDVELRKDMWRLVQRLRESGVTIILTTHYIEEAEAIADRVGVINHGELLVVDDKQALMHKLGKRQLIVELESKVSALPAELEDWALDLSADGGRLTYTY
ncbi:MAG: ABC transporter ATP-binding protein, partial [Gammaproteobacteria bacterium]